MCQCKWPFPLTAPPVCLDPVILLNSDKRIQRFPHLSSLQSLQARGVASHSSMGAQASENAPFSLPNKNQVLFRFSLILMCYQRLSGHLKLRISLDLRSHELQSEANHFPSLIEKEGDPSLLSNKTRMSKYFPNYT